MGWLTPGAQRLWQFGALALYQNAQLRKGINDTLAAVNALKAESLFSIGGYAQGTWRQFYSTVNPYFPFKTVLV